MSEKVWPALRNDYYRPGTTKTVRAGRTNWYGQVPGNEIDGVTPAEQFGKRVSCKNCGHLFRQEQLVRGYCSEECEVVGKGKLNPVHPNRTS